MAPFFFLPAAILIIGLLSTTIAEIITLKPLRLDDVQPLANVPAFRSRVYVPDGPSTVAESSGDLELLDVVLLASVDGKFHALNRTSGRILWSMSSSTSSGAVPSMLAPLVRTDHAESDPDLAGDDNEFYIIEPQSGDIYVSDSPFGPLKRLSLSMSQLVDLSPLGFSGDDDRRTFTGKKETSLLLIDLETGKVINSECPWDPFEDLRVNESDLDEPDELDGTTPLAEPPKPMEVFIGRTDYYVSIRHHGPPPPKAPVQNLSFSAYGPNNQDKALQATYRQTPDDTYIQPLPDGNVIQLKSQGSVRSKQDSHITWAHTFNNPIVAVFDVFRSPSRRHPLVLLQPRPRIQDVLPGKIDNLPNLASAYVGLVEGTGSLFAMGPDHYPLVMFGDTRRIEGTSPGSERDPHTDISDDDDPSPPEMCRNGSPNRKCLTGIRPLEEDKPSRFPRLLDGSPSVALPPEGDFQDFPFPNHNHSPLPDSSRWNNMSDLAAGIPRDSLPPPWSRNIPLSLDGSTITLSATFALVSSLFLGLVWFISTIIATRRLKIIVKSAATNGIAEDDTRIPSQQPLITTRPEMVPLEEELHSPPPNQITLPASRPPPPEDSNPVPSPTFGNDHAEAAEEMNEREDSDRDGDSAVAPGKRKGRRGKRGKKKKTVLVIGGDGEDEKGKENDNVDTNEVEPAAVEPDHPPADPAPPAPHPTPPEPTLVVSDTILGYGSHGTVVFQGSLQNRSVAVKRLLQDFVTLASREVSILQESDDHPNVIRYYYQEARGNFLYIALELCPASLADVIENPEQHRDISVSFDPKRAVRQITSGLRHLHALKIVHRDIKPQNILISSTKQSLGLTAGHRMLISDFGLCKKLDLDQTSFLATAHGTLAAGTVGWRAPEILRGEVKLDESINDDQSQTSRDSVGTPTTSTASGKTTRLTKSVDIFALGCLFYYTLTNGCHPFGDRFEREVNILKDAKNLEGLERFGEEGSEATDLIEGMLHPDARERPDTTTCLLHPYFWNPGRRLSFLQDASDRFEIMCRDPRDPNLVALETDAVNIVGSDWHNRLDKIFIDNLGKFRKYDGKSVQDLLRALRNKKHHYQDLPDNVKRHLGPMPEGFLSYFTRRFPRLFLHVHAVVAGTSLRQESMFRSYFELPDS